MNGDEAQISLMSWNIHALRNKVDYLTYVTMGRQVDIVFLQETHIGPRDCRVFKKLGKWESFYTVYEPNSEGVAILIKKDIDFQLIESYKGNGNYIIVKCKIRDQPYTLVNVYNHQFNRSILNKLIPYLQECTEGVLVIGGDFNTTINPYLDRTSRTENSSHAALQRHIERFMAYLHLVDVWRRINQTKIQYTFSQNYNKSRLDYIFMQEESMWRVNTCEILDTVEYSDHKPVCLQLTSTPSSHSPPPDTDLYFLVAPILAWHLEKDFKDMTAKAKNETQSLLVIHPGRKEKVKWSLLKEAIEALEDPLLKSTLFDKLLRRSDQDQDCKQLQPGCLLTTALLKLYVTQFMLKVQTDELFPSGVTTGTLIYGETVMMSLSFKANEKLKIRQSLLEETRRQRQDLISAIFDQLPRRSMQDEDEHEEEEEDEDEDQDQLYKQLCCDHPLTPGLLTLCVAHLMSKVQTRGRFFPTRPKIKNLTDNETVMISVSFK